MTLSLNLPYSVCWPLVRAIRRRDLAVPPSLADPTEYFRRQYRSSPSVADRFMRGIEFEDRFVIDVGGGLGGRMPYFFDRGAREVWCIDINRDELQLGAAIMQAEFPQYADRAKFYHPDDVPSHPGADVAVLVDSFEHLVDPSAVLAQCAANLAPGGVLWIGSIGWYNYMASHCLWHVPIPWCQVIFSETAILKTIRKLLRSPDYQPVFWEVNEGLDRWDKVDTLRDRPGEPLNQLSLRRIRKALRSSPFVIKSFTLYPPAARTIAGKLVRPLLAIPVLDELLHGYYTTVLERR